MIRISDTACTREQEAISTALSRIIVGRYFLISFSRQYHCGENSAKRFPGVPRPGIPIRALASVHRPNGEADLCVSLHNSAIYLSCNVRLGCLARSLFAPPFSRAVITMPSAAAYACLGKNVITLLIASNDIDISGCLKKRPFFRGPRTFLSRKKVKRKNGCDSRNLDATRQNRDLTKGNQLSLLRIVCTYTRTANEVIISFGIRNDKLLEDETTRHENCVINLRSDASQFRIK